MYEKLVLFSNRLRNEGMLVSIRTTTTAKQFLEQNKDRITDDQLYSVLKAIYLKDKDDVRKFDKVFYRMFKETKKKEDTQSQGALESLSMESSSPHEAKQLQEEINNLKENYKQDQEAKKVSQDVIANESMVLLDGFDPRVFEMCKRLSKKVANQRSMRRKKSNKQHINMSKTIRSNLRYGGHMLNIIKDKPPLKKNKHIFLCDISGSCEWVTSWFFAIIYGCQHTFHKMRIIDFDNRIVEITDALKEETYFSIGEIMSAHRRFGLNPYGQSDMTNSFKEVLEKIDLNHRTDIIILTDCRDWNGKREDGILESAKILEEISKQVHKVMILNPEKKIRWNTPTSCVKDYQDVGVPVYEAGTLEQFANVISRL